MLYKDIETKPTNKKPFEFQNIRPVLDWYESKVIKLEWNTYDYYRIERRYGPSWWLIGINLSKDNTQEEVQIASMTDGQLKEFIKWAKTEDNGSKIVSLSTISGKFDVIQEIFNLMEN